MSDSLCSAKKMHIGVDARPLSEALTGIGRYTFELSKRLVQAPRATFSFYAPSPIENVVAKSIKVGNFRSASCHNRFIKMAWSQTLLPYWARKDNINLFWGPTHRLPTLLPESIARVVTIHDLVWKYAPQTMRPLSLAVEKRFMPEAIVLADLVMADSQSTACGIAEVFPQFAHKVRVVHLGTSALPDPDLLILNRLNLTKPYFLSVGTAEPRKNLERLLGAYTLLPESSRNQFDLVIAGGLGWGGVNLEKSIREHGLQHSVRLLGYVNDQQLATLYSNAKFLVMPSLYEGFGLPLLEAMQYGTPVLTTHNSSLSEVADDAGLLIDPYSIESISAGIQRMLVDDELIKKLSINALRRAQEFSWEKSATETMTVFEEALVLRDIRVSRN